MTSQNPQPEEVTRLLVNYSKGDQQALEQLLPLVYNELRRLAAGYLRREREDHTLQPTALVHEAYLRLLGQEVEWQNRAHFFGVAANMMRRILVDHARQHQAEKRGSGDVKISLDEAINLSQETVKKIFAVLMIIIAIKMLFIDKPAKPVSSIPHNSTGQNSNS